MNKIQTIICLLVFLVILISTDMIFGYSIRETFSSKDEISVLKNDIKRDDKFIGDDQPFYYTYMKNK